ncbi:MAG: glycoside hydrolase family 43 protein, partial [Treponema sp.]|nr:glycoside hydrolase family 43 protein [Treponema sp.]
MLKSKKTFAGFLAVCCAVLLTLVFTILAARGAMVKEPDLSYPFSNPIVYKADDPWVIYDKRKGFDCYYYVWSGGNGIRLGKMDDFYKLDEVYNVPGRFLQAWTASPGTPYSNEIWAPEIHFLSGKWYIYFTACSVLENHRMYILESKTSDPMDGFDFLGELKTIPDRWAIDGTVMQYKGKLYFIWSGWEGLVNEAQHIYIAEMESPVKISSERVKLSSPELSWELTGFPLINEGPAAIEHNGLMHIMYSANVSWVDEYCVGLLTLTGSDPLDANAWTKKDGPVLE